MRKLTIATRRSPLAMWQAEHVAALLRSLAPQYEITLLPMTTSGDKASQTNWALHAGKGMFIKELEEAMLDNRADLAVHSMKDLPAILPKPFSLAAICKRDNPFDALISREGLLLDQLPKGAKIGTASLRRQAQLKAYRPDLTIEPLRGNVQTRLSKLNTAHFDAIILAAAGLSRLGLADLITEELTPPLVIPACGQGAIGIECRQQDKELISLLNQIHCENSDLCVKTERQVNALLGGHCHVPIGIFCTAPKPNLLHLQVRVLNPSGSEQVETTLQGKFDEATQLAKECAKILLALGAEKLIHAAS